MDMNLSDDSNDGRTASDSAAGTPLRTRLNIASVLSTLRDSPTDLQLLPDGAPPVLSTLQFQELLQCVTTTLKSSSTTMSS